MNIINTLALTEQLKSRTSLSDRDAAGIVQTIAEVAEDRWSNLVTRDQFDARFAEQDSKFAELRAYVRSEIAELRAELRSEVADLRSELRTQIASVRTEIANLRAEMNATIRAQTMWLMGTMIAAAGLAVAVAKLL